MESHLYSWIRRINIVKMALSSGSTYNNAIPIRIPSGFFAEIGNLILKFMWKGKGSRNLKTILKSAKLEDSYFLISKCTTKLQQSSQYNTHIKRTEFGERNKTLHLWPVDYRQVFNDTSMGEDSSMGE